MEEYQDALDAFQAIDGDFYESNIRKQLKLAGLAGYENQLLTSLSGGEFKLVPGNPGNDGQPRLYHHG